MRTFTLLLIITFFAACGGGADKVNEDTASLTSIAPAAAPSDNPENGEELPTSEDTAKVIPENENTTEVIAKPNEELVEKSVVAKVPCCQEKKNLTDPQECCCDLVLETFEGYMKKGDIDTASEMGSTDPFYPACETKFQEKFTDRINAILDKYLTK